MAPRTRVIDDEATPESDRAGDLPHPRERFELFGHEAAARTLAQAARSGHMHHAWIIAGPRGVGKATLAWRFARALLNHGAEHCPDDLSCDPGSQASTLVTSLAHPDLILLRRPWDEDRNRAKTVLTVDEVRRLHGFFARHPAYGGFRIAIIDAADDMNPAAQNALLKTLEEPPARALLLLVSHAPGSLLPTTRSRCRMLHLRRLPPAGMQDALARLAPGLAATESELVAALAEGAPGRAAGLIDMGAVPMYREITGILAGLPGLDYARVFQLADLVSKGGAAGKLRLFADLLLQLEERLLRGLNPSLPTVPGEARVLAAMQSALPTGGWLEQRDRLAAAVQRADDLNLDKKQVVLNAFHAIATAARR